MMIIEENKSSSHGFVGSHLQPFTELLPTRTATFAAADLLALSVMMKSNPDQPADGPDPEENLWLPAGYTYFGQFVDHDLTFDSTSSLNPADRPPQGSHIPSNLRTPRFDLDNIYGDGPSAMPFMYDSDGASLLVQANDLMRAANGRAIIGDKRNDENSIICQIQIGMIRYHNNIVAALLGTPPQTWNTPNKLFESAQNEVRWTYQLILVQDFLPRLIQADVLADLQGHTPFERRNSYVLYKSDKRANLPREFVGAAYRYGHSGVRTGYRLNAITALDIFPGTDHGAKDPSLLGFEPLPESHIIDTWDHFFPATVPGADINITGRVTRVVPAFQPLLQYAYKIDTTLVDPLAALPKNVPEPTAAAEAAEAIKPAPLPDGPLASLALLNLLRGNTYGLATGQDVARALKDAGKPVAVLTTEQLVVRVPSKLTPIGETASGVQAFQWTPVPAALSQQTPLWFYVLAEAQTSVLAAVPGDAKGVFFETHLLNGGGARTQLGWVGGRIVAEVFYGLLDEDEASVFNHPGAVNFKPRLAGGADAVLCMRNLLDF